MTKEKILIFEDDKHIAKPVIDRVVSILRKQADNKSVKVNVTVPRNIPDVLGDEAAIFQVLMNLIDNAIKYTESNGVISISAKTQGRFGQTDVADNGVGIPEKDLPRIFERFYRVDKARSRELGGTGLGLSIVKHIVRAHNGEVFFRSVEGKGATFSFTRLQSKGTGGKA